MHHWIWIRSFREKVYFPISSEAQKRMLKNEDF